MDKEELQKELFKTVLRHAVADCVEEDCAPIRERYKDIEPVYSRKFRTQMKKLMRENAQTSRRAWTKTAK